VSTHTATIPLPQGSPAWHRAANRAKRLSWLSLLYMGVEGAVAVIAAILAGSIAPSPPLPGGKASKPGEARTTDPAPGRQPC